MGQDTGQESFCPAHLPAVVTQVKSLFVLPTCLQLLHRSRVFLSCPPACRCFAVAVAVLNLTLLLVLGCIGWFELDLIRL